MRLSPAPLALAIFLCAGCREPSLHLHYLPGFVPGTRNAFAPIAIAIAPPVAVETQDRREVGAVLDPGGTGRKLYAEGLANQFASWIVHGLKDAGLRPVVMREMPADGKPPGGAEFLLVADLEELRVDKRFGAETTVHGRYFTMHSRAVIGVEVFDRTGRKIFSGKVSGTEDEPPAPVGNEAFLPLETDPAESLSVALSRAIGAIVLDPGLRRVLPSRM